ncbi:MAG: hypothetical protein JSU07_13470 [Bacteroidetes bacterium]|nr:hypothetical protein [Bacteroidota bacterium]
MNHKSKYLNVVILISAFCIAFIFISCKKSNQQQQAPQNPVPYTPINYTLYVNDPLNFKIQIIGGWQYYNNVGINGVIIYRKTQQDFVIIERTSSYLPNNANAKVKVMSDNFTLTDTISGSQWIIVDGSIKKGPATWPLRQYANSYDPSSSALLIKN